MNQSESLTAIANFIFELGQLRRIKHEGWRLAGVDHPESVADHSLRAAQIAYFLAKMEGYPDPNEVVTMLVFHDSGECRVGDVHKVASRYVEVDELQAVKDQLGTIGEFGTELLDNWQIVEERRDHAGNIAKDADLLEQAFMGKEYLEKGYTKAQNWLNNIERHLQTESALELLKELQEIHSTDWWEHLKKLKR